MYGMGGIKVLCRLTFYGCLALWLCTSCAGYRVLQVEVLEPAGLTLEKGRTIGFWDRNIRPAGDSSFVLNRQPGLSADELSHRFYSVLQSVLCENETDSLLHLAGRDKRYVSDGEIPAPAGAGKLTEFSRRFGMDYVVSLEKIGYAVDVREKRVSCNLFLRLYDCNRGRVSDSVLYENDLTEVLAYEEGLAENINGIMEMRGVEYARLLKPYWVCVERRIYNGGRVLGMGDIFFLRNDREQARKLWEAATSLNTRQAIRGYLNLAWMYENEGDFYKAEQMLRNGLDIAAKKGVDNADTDYLKIYMEIMVKRIKERALLERQM